MRIGIDARFYSPSFTGIGRYVYELVNRVTQLDTQSNYVLFFNEPFFSTFVPPREGVMKILADAPHYSLREQTHFARVLSRAKLDLMHFTHFNAPILYRKPSIVTIHDLTVSLFPGAKMIDWISRAAYHATIASITRRAHRVIAVSQYTKTDLKRLLKVPEEKISVIYEAAASEFRPITDANLLQTFREKMNLSKPYLLYTGVWRSHKNIVGLIRAFALLKKSGRFDGELVITGRSDCHYPEVEDAIQKTGMVEHIRLVGHVPDNELVLLYNCAEVYVLPSFYEGFGLPILEAFSCGTPVCASFSSCLPEIAGRTNALFFNPHDPEDIANKIAMVLVDGALRAKLIARGLKRAAGFSWEDMARKTVEIYNEIHEKGMNS